MKFFYSKGMIVQIRFLASTRVKDTFRNFGATQSAKNWEICQVVRFLRIALQIYFFRNTKTQFINIPLLCGYKNRKFYKKKYKCLQWVFALRNVWIFSKITIVLSRYTRPEVLKNSCKTQYFSVFHSNGYENQRI